MISLGIAVCTLSGLLLVQVHIMQWRYRKHLEQVAALGNQIQKKNELLIEARLEIDRLERTDTERQHEIIRLQKQLAEAYLGHELARIAAMPPVPRERVVEL
jgi:hypothetical protein